MWYDLICFHVICFYSKYIKINEHKGVCKQICRLEKKTHIECTIGTKIEYWTCKNIMNKAEKSLYSTRFLFFPLHL